MIISQLLNDYTAFSQEKYVEAQAPFNLTRYLGQETHLGVWETPNLIKAFAPNGLLNHPNASVLTNYIDARVSKALSNVGNDDSNLNPSSGKLLRNSLIKFACSHQLQSCAPHAKKRFEEWKSNPQYIPTFNSADGYECGVVTFGGQEAFDFVFQQYVEHEQFIPQSEILADALACATESEVLEGFLNKTLSPLEFRPIFSELVYSSLTTRPNSQKRVIPFLTSHFNQVEEALGITKIEVRMVEVIEDMVEGISTRKQVDEVKTFLQLFESRMGEEEKGKVENAFKRMEDNISWMDRVGNEIISYASAG